VDESYSVVSPTFTLLNVYPGRVSFYHADLYRLEEGDVEEMELIEQAGPGVLAVEWAERALALWPAGALWVELAATGDGARRAVLRGPEKLVGRLKAALDG
jgi:tRNA threonylcarbamoyl adenosine modification protein YjeE